MAYRELSVEDIPVLHPVSVFNAFWSARRTVNDLPRRIDFGPATISSLVRWLLVLEPVLVEGAMQFRYRLNGTGCAELFGIDYTGKLLGENLLPETVEVRRREFLRVLESGEPVYSWSKLPIDGRDFLKVYRGVFPVTVGGEVADQIIVVIAHEALRLEPASQLRRA